MDLRDPGLQESLYAIREARANMSDAKAASLQDILTICNVVEALVRHIDQRVSMLRTRLTDLEDDFDAKERVY